VYGADGVELRYLAADHSIECDTRRHRFMQLYAGAFILVYPIGIPTLYSCVLYRNRKILNPEAKKLSEKQAEQVGI
jgi:hypothetical protein